MRKKELCCDQRHYMHISLYIMPLATSWMIALLTTHKILNKRRIKGLVYWTRSSVIFVGPELLGSLGRGLCVYNVFGYIHGLVHRHRRICQGGWGAAAPPVSNYSGKTPKIRITKKLFSGNFSGAPPPTSRQFFRANRAPPPQVGSARYAYVHRYIILIDEQAKVSLGYLRNSREMNIMNSWIFLPTWILSSQPIQLL